jgi:hypothetical protein
MRSTTKIILDQRPTAFKSNVTAIFFMALLMAFIVIVIYAALYIGAANTSALKPTITFNKGN